MSDEVNDLRNLEPIHSENLGYREGINATTSYNGGGSRVCTKEDDLRNDHDNQVYDLDTTTIAFAEQSKTIKVGQEYKPVINTTPWIKNLPALTLISGDEDIVQILPGGIIFGVEPGTTTVTAMSSPGGMNSDPDVSATTTITVE